jgi:putative oxidoreductase
VRESFLAPLTEPAYALLRVVSGLLFSFHGVQKIFGVLSDGRPPVGSQVWFGGMIELLGGLAIAVGLLTPWAALLASGEMAVAYVQFHWKLQGGANFFPTINKGELAVLYAVVFLYVACRGGGRFSLDAAVAAARPAPAVRPA